MRIALLLFLMTLAGCDRGPPAPTAAQNDQMNDAEAVLDEMAANEATAN